MSQLQQHITPRGRFAPSPSGYMHLGNAFSVLLSWLSIRSANGEFLLRFEDLDDRCLKSEYRESIIEDLHWMGIDWDGEVLVQSTRSDVYEAAFKRISRCANVYPCFCTRADLHAASAPHASDGTPIYAGTCYGMSKIDASEHAKTRNPSLRLHVPDTYISFCDAHMGPYEQNLKYECGDFVVRRSDGVFAYQLACVCDDIASGVTQIVRGSDLLSSTPRQMYLYELLGAEVPEYCHHPLLIAPDGRRLSKRNADLELQRIRNRGTSAEELIGVLAHYAGLLEQTQPVKVSELIEGFSWEKVPRHEIVVQWT